MTIRQLRARLFFAAMVLYVLITWIVLGYIHEGATGWQLLTHFWYVWALAACLLLTSLSLARMK